LKFAHAFSLRCFECRATASVAESWQAERPPTDIVGC
jgi:hypothetical protein